MWWDPIFLPIMIDIHKSWFFTVVNVIIFNITAQRICASPQRRAHGDKNSGLNQNLLSELDLNQKLDFGFRCLI